MKEQQLEKDLDIMVESCLKSGRFRRHISGLPGVYCKLLMVDPSKDGKKCEYQGEPKQIAKGVNICYYKCNK